jgi:predicted site-specific integrase-resolvase
MPVIINGEIYYRTLEVCRVAGIGRSTLLRWFNAGILNDVPLKDRRGWRLFSETDVKRIEEEANRVK